MLRVARDHRGQRNQTSLGHGIEQPARGRDLSPSRVDVDEARPHVRIGAKPELDGVAVKGLPALERARLKDGGEREGIGLDPIAHHLDEVEKRLPVKTQVGMVVDEGGPVEDGGGLGRS